MVIQYISYQLRPVSDVQFLKDTVEVSLHGRFTDIQFLGDLFVLEALTD